MPRNSPPRLPELDDHDLRNTDTYDTMSDDISIGYRGVLDHAPITSQGTYLDGINEGLEPLGEYQDGRYHPVHLDDLLGASGHYRVIHKLGRGGFRTVWLCRDMRQARYVTVKVMVGGVTADNLADISLGQMDRSAPGSEYIAIPLNSFSIEGPNGCHQCIVLLVLGPRVSPGLWLRMKKDPSPVLRGMARQTTEALRFLHNNSLFHG